MLYTLDEYIVTGQVHLNKTGKKAEIKLFKNN